MAHEVVAQGYRLECEQLRTGEASFYVAAVPQPGDYPGTDDQPIACEVVPNGPEVEEAVDRLVRSAYSATCNDTAQRAKGKVLGACVECGGLGWFEPGLERAVCPGCRREEMSA